MVRMCECMCKERKKYVEVEIEYTRTVLRCMSIQYHSFIVVKEKSASGRWN